MKYRRTARAAALGLLLSAAAARSQLNAHEFIIKPAQLQVESGAKLPFSIIATHFFFVSEAVEPVNTVKAWLFEGDKSIPVEVRENHVLQTLDGVAKLERKGTAVLVGHLREPIEPVKVAGSNRSQKIKREKFAKAFVTVSADDDSYKKVFGQKLEVVPISNVTKARVGEELSFRILLDGEPLKGQVFATYDGFSGRYMTFAQATETLDDGLAYVKITNPGTWMIRAENRLEAKNLDYDNLSLKATLVFSVN